MWSLGDKRAVVFWEVHHCYTTAFHVGSSIFDPRVLSDVCLTLPSFPWYVPIELRMDLVCNDITPVFGYAFIIGCLHQSKDKYNDGLA